MVALAPIVMLRVALFSVPIAYQLFTYSFFKLITGLANAALMD